MNVRNKHILPASTIRRIILQIAVLAAAGSLLAATNLKVAPDLASASGAQNVIVTYSAPPTDTDDQVIRKHGKHKGRLDNVNAIAANVPAEELDNIAALPNVKHVSLDHPVKPTLDYSTAAVNADVAFQNGFLGTGVGVAVIDSGINPHDDLGGSRKSSRIV